VSHTNVFHSSDGSCVAVERRFRREFSVRVTRSRDVIYRGIQKFEKQEACGGDKSAKGRKRRASVRTEGVVGAARREITRNPRECAKFSTKDWSLNHHCTENL
jgi:hypothetical protein